VKTAGKEGWGMRGLLQNLTLAAVSVVVTIVGLEAAARLVGFQTRGSWSAPSYQLIPGIGHLFIPGYQGTMYKGISTGWRDIPVRINSHGLRGAEFPVAKPAGVDRILVIGDSFAFGYLLQEDEAMAAYLQRLLDAARGPGRTHVINAGVPGFGIFNERGFLEHRGLAFGPDVVVLFVTPGDIADAATRKNDEGTQVDISKEVRLYTAVRTSALMNAMEYGFFSLVRAIDPKLSLATGLHAETLSPGLATAWGRYQEGFKRFASVAKDKGIPVLLVVYPGELQLYSDGTRVQDRWRQLADDNGVAFLDLLPVFRPVRGRRLYIPADGHPSAVGNQLAAEQVAAWLAAH
jgi:lysophospholipase L1-like esterase